MFTISYRLKGHEGSQLESGHWFPEATRRGANSHQQKRQEQKTNKTKSKRKNAAKKKRSVKSEVQIMELDDDEKQMPGPEPEIKRFTSTVVDGIKKKYKALDKQMQSPMMSTHERTDIMLGLLKSLEIRIA